MIHSDHKTIASDDILKKIEEDRLMKLTCEYCGSFVEPDENGKCPCCTAPMGKLMEAAIEEQRLKEAETAAQALQDKKEEITAQTVGNVISSLGTALANRIINGGTRQQLGSKKSEPPMYPMRGPVADPRDHSSPGAPRSKQAPHGHVGTGGRPGMAPSDRHGGRKA